jgi:hypothetical protein
MRSFGLSLRTCLMRSIPLRPGIDRSSKQHVEVAFAYELQRLVSVTRLANDFDVVFGRESRFRPSRRIV